jgi:hypothetical protein
MLTREEVTVLSPNNDGESRTIIDICRRLGVDVRVSQQPWGGTLDQEPESNLRDLRRSLIVVEMPSPEREREFERAGYQLIVVDHHSYPNLNLDRRQPESSLEQVASHLGYELSRWEKGVAINDRAYIFGLIDAGYSMEEILALRRFDLESQGVPPEKIEAVKAALQTAPVKNGITILKLDFVNAGFAQDFLVMENPRVVKDLLILGGNPVRKVQFYGDPAKVERLADIGEWMGGGKKSRFWGTNHPDLPEIFRRLGIGE